MSDEPIKASDFAEQLLILNQQIGELRASVNVLKVLEALRLNPTDPASGVKAIQHLEQKQLSLDPSEQLRQEAFELIDAVKQWKKMGEPHGKA